MTRFANQMEFFPHEKIYLHTDKPYYITGEKIFFRAFLLDAFTQKTPTLSRYVYVELINPVDSVVNRVKIRPDENDLFHGALVLPEDLPQGVYKIIAYTQYMRNQGESSFFSKQVRICDPQILSIRTESDFQFDEAGKVNASLRFMDVVSGEVIHPKSITFRLNRGRSFTAKPERDGWIRIKQDIRATSSSRAFYIELTEKNRIYRQYLQIPYPAGDFDVSFYPEGGHLVAGKPSNVAFKAVNVNGAALDVKGEVTDSKGNTVAAITTIHDGMGDFTITPQPGERYQATCSDGNRTLLFNLPEVQVNTFSLKTTVENEKLIVKVNGYNPASHPGVRLLIHLRGMVVYFDEWDGTKDYVASVKR